MFVCTRCKLEFREGAQCSSCQGHFDFPCAGITENGYRKLGDRRNTWRCATCKVAGSSSPRSGSSKAPFPVDLEKVMEDLKCLRIQLAPLPSMIETVKLIQTDLKSLKADIADLKLLKSDIADVKASMDFVQYSVDTLTGKVSALDKEVQELKKSKDDISILKQQRAGAAEAGRARGRGVRGVPWRGGTSRRCQPARPGGVYGMHSASNNFRTTSSTFNNENVNSNNKYVRRDNSSKCMKCGITHGYNQCPAYGRRCLNCNNLNHFSRVCNNVYEVQSEFPQADQSPDQVIYYFHEPNSKWCVDLLINGNKIQFKLDTGADVNVLPRRYLQKIGMTSDSLMKSAVKLRGYSGGDIKVVGRCNIKVKYKDVNYILDFIIADVDSPPILGCQSCQELNLIKLTLAISKQSNDNFKEKILHEYKDVFEGLGCMPGEYKIAIDKSVRPVVHAPRKLPVAIKEKVKNKLNEMEMQKIISKVEGPSNWVSSMTVVRKPNGDLRICLDPKDLNKAIKREHFHLPTLDEITTNLAGSKFYSTLDAKNGFWQLKLNEKSADLCTFNTAFGRYKFLRLPYGISSASEVFHKKMYENFDDIEGVCLFVDDLLIYGKTQYEHDERLKRVLDRCRLINLKLNKEKCKFALMEIKYLESTGELVQTGVVAGLVGLGAVLSLGMVLLDSGLRTWFRREYSAARRFPWVC
ncbi:uncharacterized protein LOC123722914 [Papilio machaon]|uniref:uncharacterized protein LOC123722914 n=1 Tax=Papilio machaon TaxID=76193 RepID=UPI001E663C46|nr:uncharacterized protein LOC123722914 [Papilio machaon]